MEGKPLILVVYAYNEQPPRHAITDHLFAFERYSGGHVVHLNLGYVNWIPPAFARLPFDVIIFHTTFLAQRWTPHIFEQMVACCAPLRDHAAVKVALPQDEFIHTDSLSAFLAEFGVDLVFSVSPPKVWPHIYGRLDPGRARIRQALTGYLADHTVATVERLAKEGHRRDIDIGYRAWDPEFWLGRHGLLKRKVGDAARSAAQRRGLHADISNLPQDTFRGDDWYRFLLRCKATVGVEGGASVIDRDGSIRHRTNEYLRAHPSATFEEVEAACFPGVDGRNVIAAISPRHLEACATRTCQLLVQGDYNGVLQPWTHYVPVFPDLSNIDSALEFIAKEENRSAIVENAHRDIVQSGKYGYRRFVEGVLGEVAAIRAPPPRKEVPRGVRIASAVLAGSDATFRAIHKRRLHKPFVRMHASLGRFLRRGGGK